MVDVAQREKEKGNSAFRAGDFPTAIGHYTAAFIADSSNVTYPLNRAAAYLKLGKNEDAERDCDTVLRLDRNNVKGYFRRAQAKVALHKYMEAEADFKEVLRLDHSNDAAKQELCNIQESLKDIALSPKTRKPIDLLKPPLAAAAPPKRRRIPIKIVEPEAGPSTRPSVLQSTTTPSMLTAVSSRPLDKVSTLPSPVPPKQPSTSPQSTQESEHLRPNSPKVPQTFREAKVVREETRPRGGIFRADGPPSLFYAPSPFTIAKPPKKEVPQTLIAFTRIWDELKTEEERWDVLREIPAKRLPVLFKTSLNASTLAAITRSLRLALENAPEDSERAQIVRAYMVNLPRVPRFSTVSLMMSVDERAYAQVVWDLLGRFSGDGVKGEMDKRKEDGSRSAWGCH